MINLENTKNNEIDIDVESLVEHIDLLEYVSQYLDLEERRGEYWCRCVFHIGDETASLSFNPEKQIWFCLGCKHGGNVYTFAKEYHKLSPQETVLHLCDYAKLDVGTIKAPPDTIRYLRKLKRTFDKKNIDFGHKTLNKDCMLIYDKEPIKEWLSEGISQEILDKYDVRYDKMDNAIIFPIYGNDGEIINLKKRTLNENFKLLKRPKYINLYKIGTLDYLFGFVQNKHLYDKYNDIIVFEGEKSVMKFESVGYFNSVALSTSSITKEQANTLIKTGKNIILCLDKGIPLSQILRTFDYLIRFTNVYVVLDNDNLLDNKMAPIDNGIEIFKQLYNKKIKL